MAAVHSLVQVQSSQPRMRTNMTLLVMLCYSLSHRYVFIGHKLKTLRNNMSVVTDRRVKIMSEVLSGMRVLKMNGWITPFRDLLRNIRVEELGMVREISMIKVSADFASPGLLSREVILLLWYNAR